MCKSESWSDCCTNFDNKSFSKFCEMEANRILIVKLRYLQSLSCEKYLLRRTSVDANLCKCQSSIFFLRRLLLWTIFVGVLQKSVNKSRYFHGWHTWNLSQPSQPLVVKAIKPSVKFSDWKASHGLQICTLPCWDITVATSSLKLPRVIPVLKNWRCITWNFSQTH